MSKGQIIDEIRRLNPTAHPSFLARFDERQLREYLEHLQAARQKRLRIHSTAPPTAALRMVS
jgi:hypothetical protein